MKKDFKFLAVSKKNNKREAFFFFSFCSFSVVELSQLVRRRNFLFLVVLVIVGIAALRTPQILDNVDFLIATMKLLSQLAGL